MRPFKPRRPAVAVLDLTGEINEAQALSVLMCLRNTDWGKRQIRGVIVRVCSNGGSLGAAQAICEGIDTLRSELGLFTVGLITDTALSAGFYAALACDRVVATPAATIGNAGAIIGHINAWPLAQKLGISFQTARSGPGKGALHPLAAPSEAGDAMMMETVGDIAEQFFEWIAKTRGTGPEALATLADGRMLSGRQAQALGLVDTCGGLFTALRLMGEQLDAPETALVWLNPQSPSMLGRVVKLLKGLF